MAKDSQFFARVDAVGKSSKVMISDEVGLNAQLRGWYVSVRVTSEVGISGFNIYAGDGSNATEDDVLIGRVVYEGGSVRLLPSLYTKAAVDREDDALAE